jgi:hypothetical protein
MSKTELFKTKNGKVNRRNLTKFAHENYDLNAIKSPIDHRSLFKVTSRSGRIASRSELVKLSNSNQSLPVSS